MSTNEVNQSNKLNIRLGDVESGDVTIGDITIGGNISAGGDVNQTTIQGDQYITHGLTVDQVEALFVTLKTEEQPEVWDGRIPYLGLYAFQENDAQFFFGREALVDDLLERVERSPFITISGPSGSGKSSVARAGLFHALRSGRIAKSEQWLLATMKPEGNPLENLARAFERATKSAEAGDALREDPANLIRQVDIHLTDDGSQRFVLLVDQFEEVFTQTKDVHVRKAFIDLLTTAAQDPDNRIVIILSLRSDFISNCTTIPNLRHLMSRELQLVGGMGVEDLAKAISLPAIEVGAVIDPALVSRIITDMKGEPGALPLMSFALRDLFEVEKTKKGEPMDMTLPEYIHRGGIESALERHAEAAFSELTDAQKTLTRSTFRQLVEVGQGRADTRRVASLAELIPAEDRRDDVMTLIERLSQADVRLIMVSGSLGEGQTESATVTIAHEKLIDAWPWLRRLVDENRELIALQNQINQDAQEWAAQQDDGYLYRGGRLAQIEERKGDLDGQLNDLASRFIGAAVAQRENEERNAKRARRRLIRFSVAVTILLFIAIGVSNFAFDQTRISSGRALASAAQNAANNGQGSLAGLLAMQSSALSDEEGGDQFLMRLPYLDQLFDQALFGHDDAVSSVAWSADGRLASGSADASVIIWDREASQAALRLVGHEGPVHELAWFADGRYLASASEDHTVIIWDTSTGESVQQLIGHTDIVMDVSWASDGRLASASADNTVIVWDAMTGDITHRLRGHSDPVHSVDWSSDGRLASGSVDQTLIVWDLDVGEVGQRFENADNGVRSLAWVPDGRIAYGAYSGAVLIVNLETGHAEHVLQGHTAIVTGVAWSADGQLASSSDSQDIIVWDLERAEIGQRVAGPSKQLTSVAWSPDGRLASGTSDEAVVVWDMATDRSAYHLRDHSSLVSSVAWSDDGRLASSSFDSSVVVWDIEAETPALKLMGHESAVIMVAWSADGRLASTSDDDTVIVWDSETGDVLHRLIGHSDTTIAVAWSADGRLASSSEDGVIIWDLDTGEVGQRLEGHEGWVIALAWSADGRLATGSAETIMVWDVARGEPTHHLTDHTALVTSVAWSPEGQLASAAEDHNVIVWDLDTGAAAQTLLGHTDYVQTLAWSADGRLASGSWDQTVIIWDLETGGIVQQLDGHNGYVYSIDWSPTGRLASGSFDTTVWVTEEKYTGSPCAWLPRNLTEAEWLQYVGTLYVYEPVCDNLPTPNIETSALTWRGRLFETATGLSALGICAILLVGFYWWDRQRRVYYNSIQSIDIHRRV